MTYSLLVLARQITAAPRIFDIAALAVFASIVLHGITSTPGTKWIARRNPDELEVRSPFAKGVAAG
jgi:NhaP-type Na+/H+ or K+/H+ antiporter